MTTNIRLIATPGSTTDGVLLTLAFAASTPDGGDLCADAVLDFGDGETLELGVICAPTQYTWREQRSIPLASHVYADDGSYTPSLRWGDQAASCSLPKPTDTANGDTTVPELSLYSVQAVEDERLQRSVKLSIAGLAATQQVRVDGGSGQVHLISGTNGADSSHQWILEYGKPGEYVVSVDLLDTDGFWLTILAESPVRLAEPVDESVLPESGKEESIGDAVNAPAESSTAALEAGLTTADQLPWLPFRYARPLWAWAATYTTAGGSGISRRLASGTYLAIRRESEISGVLWYQTGSYDWIPASSVALMQTSALRGVELGMVKPEPEPEPEPPPEPEPEPKPQPEPDRHGRVTARALNVRERSGVSPGNPPIDQLTYNTEVDILADEPYAGATWYKIGEGRWVHSGYVQLIENSPPPDPDPDPEPKPETHQGRVTANLLNVRTAPGVSAGNPPIDQLTYNTLVTIFAEAVYAGATWYRIGDERWVHSGWVQEVAASPGQAVRLSPSIAQAEAVQADEVTLPVGWVVSSTLNVRSRPGTGTDSVLVDQVIHNQRLDILETQLAGGDNWYRIGTDKWVYGGWVGVAREKARPSTIGANERWVGVNLSEQTAVAYEGDRPVYAALVATGLPGTSTVQGIFRTWWRLESRKMSGGSGSGYYYLEEVTWTCYFYGGYALHTAYWHDAFGRPRSHGCVNLSPYDAWWLFQWSKPDGANSPAVYVYWR